MSWLYHRNVSFNRQLSTTFVLGILVLSLVSSSLISLFVSRQTEDRFLSEGIQMTNSFASQSRLALLYGAAENAEAQAATLLGFPDVAQVSIFFTDGKLLLKKGDAEIADTKDWMGTLDNEAKLISADHQYWVFAAKVVPSFVDDGIESEFEDLPPESQILGYVWVAMSKGRLTATTRRVLVINLLIAITLASILLLFLRFITKRLTTPLENLSGIMKRAESGETRIRAKLEGPKDIVDMEQAFNSMMSVLEQRESELKEARDSALETARAKAEFAAVVSHEIRTPLNGVLGMLNLLNDVGVPERQKEYLNVAISSGDALMALINDILDFSKIEAGKLEIEVIDFNLREALEDVIALFAERAQSKDIEICLDIPPDLPQILSGDVTRLRQILNNLLSNAVKFTEYGEVALSVCYRELKKQRILAEFSVIDTGIGIPADAQERIFESFRQAEGGTTRKFGGTGLGLTICKQLIDILGGNLNVESQPGKGSIFSFSMELAIAERGIVDTCFEGQQVVIGDKNPTNSAYLKSTLEYLGCTCRVAHSESDVLAALRAATAADSMTVCILDPALCESEFYSFIREIQRISDGEQPIKTVILTRPCFYEGDAKNIDATVDKPVRFSSLKRVMQQTIEGTAKVSEPADRRHKVQLVRNLNQGRILIVDDNRTNQLVAKAMLSESGFQADVASDGEEAVRLAKDKDYNLILMDCNMPVMDGYEATRKIRSLPGRSSDVTIFAMTAVDNPNDIRRCLDVGMSDCLIKPLNLAVLRKKLANLLENEQMTESVRSTNEISRIDAESFANLEQAIGSKVSEVVDAFFTDTPVYLDQLNQAVNEQDNEQLKAVAHSLKGSARNLGANVFATICREIEDLSRETDVPDSQINPLISDLENEFLFVKQGLKKKLEAQEDSRTKVDSNQNELVLVVDDDRSTRLTITNALETDGLTTEQATNGQQAIDKFVQFNPGLIIMDAIMPVKNGFDASMEIKQLPNGRRTPILMITALENDESVDRAFKSGAADFIPKPINLAVLRQRVKRVLDARQSEERVKQLAYNDGLTGLPNRIAFTDRLHQDIAYARRNGNQLAVMFIDIDHFKDVNDNLGHAAGDELLKVLAGRVERCIRSEDTLARLGGDEFVVVLSSVHGPKGADIAAHNILKTLSAPFLVAQKEIYVSASIGISIFPDDGTDRESLLKNADTAMYRAKAMGRNNYQFYTLEMSASISERIDLESDLRRVIQNEELVLYYQPKVDMRRSRVVGAEALLRWKHPRRGFLLPNRFIPIAEDSGLICEIGKWCMLKACTQFKTWHDQDGFQGRVAVNVSVREFMTPSFIRNVRDCLRISGLNAEFLEIEITENTVLDHGDETLEKLDQLASMGVTVAIDDFGVGYSAFSYLKRLQVQVLKIDRSFVRDVPEDRSGAAVIDGMIQLAHKLSLLVVAEGVEYQSQYDFLKQHDCDFVQGSMVSKPLPERDFYNQYVIQKTIRAVK